ncbi:MAG: hypothetical protein AAF242_18085, partial [Bacteroidota bacterium]
AFTILKRGNVGIGVSDPFTMLEVEGDISFGVGNNKIAPVGYDRRTLMMAGKVVYSNSGPALELDVALTAAGFVGTLTRNQAGDYTITFTTNPSPGFSAPPIVVATAAPNNTGDTRIIAVRETTTNSFRVTVRNASGTRIDDSFNFILVGENDSYFQN